MAACPRAALVATRTVLVLIRLTRGVAALLMRADSSPSYRTSTVPYFNATVRVPYGRVLSFDRTMLGLFAIVACGWTVPIVSRTVRYLQIMMAPDDDATRCSSGSVSRIAYRYVQIYPK